MSVEGGDLARLQGLDERTLVAFGAAMPELLVGSLERRYLSDFQPSLWRLETGGTYPGWPLLREVLGIGRSADDDGAAAAPALAHALTACHSPGQAFVLTVHGDGTRHRLFVGGRRVGGLARGSTEDYLERQSSVLRAHVPGLDLGPLHRLDEAPLRPLMELVEAAPALAAVTGIPSWRGRGPVELQNLDRMINAVGPHRYALTVVAEPLEDWRLDETIDRCRKLKSEVHALVRRSVSQSESESDGTSLTVPEESELDKLPVHLMSLAIFCQVAGVVSPMLGLGAQLTALVGRSLSGLSQTSISAGQFLNMRAMRSSRRSEQTSHTESLSRTAGAELLNANAEAGEALLDRHIDRLQRGRSGGWWRTSVYVAAESDGALEAVTGALRGVCSGDDSVLDPLRVVRAPNALLRRALGQARPLDLLPATVGGGHPLGDTYDSLGTPMTSDELAVLVNLPRRDVPGLPMRTLGEFALSVPPPAPPCVELGLLRDGMGRTLEPVTVTAEALNRHVFVTGMTGYGKTTTAMRLLVDAYEQFDVPFLVIEPAKAEYRRLANLPQLAGKLAVYTIGADAARPLRLNPLAPVDSVPLARHIDLLKAVFNASFPMFAGMPYVLEEAMLEVYTERGWNLHTSRNDLAGPRPSADDLAALTPSLGDLHDKIEVVLERKQYGREVHQNMGAALRSRLASLMLGAKGMALDTRRSVPVRELFSRPAVIELRNLGDDEEKAFVMALLLILLYEHAEARQSAAGGLGSERLQHLTLIEEAHRLLRAPRGPGGAEVGDPQAKAVAMFTDLLAEMRSYGEGFVVADQIPTKLAPEILKNSNVKILHRLVSPDDREAAGSCMNLNSRQTRHLANLAPGTAVVHDERIGEAVLVQIRPLTLPGPSAASANSALAGQTGGDRGDRSYLHRHAGCRRCPAPCEHWHRLPRDRDGQPAALPALDRFFEALLLGSVEQAWSAWTVWTASPVADTASDREQALANYCEATQAGRQWFERMTPRSETGQSGHDLRGAEASLRLDRTVRILADLFEAWTQAEELDQVARDRFAAAATRLAELLGSGPPTELPGCAACPARCRALPIVAPHLGALGPAVAARATTATSPAARLRAVVAAAGPVMGASVSPAALYCLISTAVGEAMTPAVEELLLSLRAGVA